MKLYLAPIHVNTEYRYCYERVVNLNMVCSIIITLHFSIKEILNYIVAVWCLQ